MWNAKSSAKKHSNICNIEVLNTHTHTHTCLFNRECTVLMVILVMYDFPMTSLGRLVADSLDTMTGGCTNPFEKKIVKMGISTRGEHKNVWVAATKMTIIVIFSHFAINNITTGKT